MALFKFASIALSFTVLLLLSRSPRSSAREVAASTDEIVRQGQQQQQQSSNNKERKKKWDERNQEEIANAVKIVNEFDQKHAKVEDTDLKKTREDLQNRVDLLQKQADNYDDRGPIIDAVVWHDGEVWRVALDTQSLEDDPNCGKLAEFEPLTNYRIERKFGIFSKLDACTFVVNVYDDGNILSIVTDSSFHGTHVAGIATAFHPEEPLLNGHKCDLINMSYGELTSLPDYGRFVDLANEVIDKHRLVFVAAAGNSGSALSTVIAPGGTTSSIIGVGAYVSPAMAAGAHAVVEPPCEGLEYTWSSRGPTADGDLGVCISAPGAAVAPVPTWTLQRRMMGCGTSMASPSACGGVALLISAMKAEGIPVSPYTVRKALENTCLPIGSLPEDKLTTGQGLMQVDKAYEYIKLSQNIPCVWYQVKMSQSGKSTPTSRGIYLREASYCTRSTEWTVQIEPNFHEDANNLEDLVPFEECIELHSTEKAVVRAPEYLLLTHNGRSFNIVVDPSNLSSGLHYYEVYGVDCKSPWRGPLFRIPVTITKPAVVVSQPPVVSYSKMSFQPGHIERRYIEVPFGATWVEATMRTSEFDTTRRFFVDTVQLCPLQRPIKWESAVMFSSPAAKSFAFPVVGGHTMELAVAQIWSSGIGSNEATSVDFEIVFHGIDINKEEVILDGSEAPVRIDAEALLVLEELAPVAILNKMRVPYRPVEAKLRALLSARDKLPSGKQILALTLTYKFKLEDGAELIPYIPLLNNRMYDTKFESQFYMIWDVNKRVHALGDVYPKSSKLPKGEYTLQLYLRHDDVQYLEKMKHLVLFMERNLEEKDVMRLNFFSQPDGPVMGNGSYNSSVLIPGKKEAIYLGPPTKDKLPKNSQPGSVLVGAISYGKVSNAGQDIGKSPSKNPASYQISYIVPPNKVEEEKGKVSSSRCTKSVSERLQEEVRDTKIKFLGTLKHGNDEEKLEWKNLVTQLKSEYPKHTPLLARILEYLLSQSDVKDKIHHNRKIIDGADEVINSIDRDELAKYFAFKSDPEDEDAEQERASAKATTEGSEDVAASGDVPVQTPRIPPNLFEENFAELKKWVDVKSSKYGTLLVIREQRHGRLGTALKVLNDIIQEDGDPPKRKLFELKLNLLEEIGWSYLLKYEREWMHVRFPACLPLF
ncbi:hypothetical protein EUGRSUZ_A02780 [Eucalyptus grandis]|uniref:Uncharacterized protein n=1 Tax=Eucalyptus grandis TaxID=71139 RepID=A0ACC3M9S8_EUCGR|nr:hypothetical protein EUGRSUZ_A02780 [Eucalyptus grandis]